MRYKCISMQTIADELDISKVTVYKALNNQPGVSKELKDKIILKGKELGYIKDSGNNIPKLKKLVYIVPKRYFLENENFYSSIYYYLNNECMDESFELSLFIIDRNSEENAIIPQPVTKSYYDGIFIAGEFCVSYLDALCFLNPPKISIDFYKPHFEIDSIIADNFFSGYYATNYLLEKGHTKVGFLGDPKQTSSISDRFFGYLKALDAYNLSYKKQWHLVNNDSDTGYYKLDIELPSEMPTSFICHCDMAAYFLIQKLNSVGISVPGDISVVSFDNTVLSQENKLSLTTIDISTRDFAFKALKQMKARIKDPLLPYQRIYIHTQLIERSSVKSLLE